MEHGERRERHIRWTVVAAVAGRGVALAVSFFSIALLVPYLGAERYGFWVALVSTVTLLVFADLGLGYGLLNRAAAALARTDGAIETRRLTSTAFYLLVAVTLGGGMLTLLVVPWLPWAGWFHQAPPAVVNECRQALLVLGLFFLAGLPFTTAQRTLNAAQLGFWTQGVEALGSLLALGGLLVVMARQGGLGALAAAYAAGPFLAQFTGWLLFFTGWRRDLRPRLADWDRALAGRMLREGAVFLVLQIGGIVPVAIAALIVLHRCGPTELAHYSLVAKLFQLGPQLAGMWFGALWPAYAEALARGDAPWAHRRLHRTTAGCLLAGGAGGLAVALAAPGLVWWWTGAVITPAPALLLGLTVGTILGMAATSLSTYLAASRCLTVQAWLVVAQVALSTLAAWVLAGWWGAAGVAWGQVAALVLVVLPVYAVIVPRVLAKQRAAT